MKNISTTVAAIAAAALISTTLAGVAYATGGGHDPITICHKGKTITVDDDAWKAHKKHGDTKGACSPEPTEEPTEEPTDKPTEEPTTEPTEEPTSVPTQEPTEAPSAQPSAKPSTSGSAPPKGSKPQSKPSKQRNGSSEPSTNSHPRGSDSSSTQRNAPTVDRDGNGVQDVYGPNVVEEGY